MSWTEGIKPREDFPKEDIKIYDEQGVKHFGEGYTFSYITWDETVPGVISIGYVNNETQDWKALTLDTRKT